MLVEMVKSRDIVAGGYKEASETSLLTIRESELFKTYLTLMEDRVSLTAIKHGQRQATTAEKQTIKEQAQNLNFEFNPDTDHKVWCKISLFAIAPDPEAGLKIEKKTYKALERIDPSENWQQDWLSSWLVIDDESTLTINPLLGSIVANFGVKYTNLVKVNELKSLIVANPDQMVMPETKLISAIANAGGEQKRIELQAEIRKIEEESISQSSKKKGCITYLKNDKYQLPIERKVLNISAYVGRT